MKIFVCENYEEISSKAAELFREQIENKPDSVLGLATGSTPIGTYKCLIQMYKEGKIDFKDVTSFNLDEYYPIEKTNSQSYHYFMNENLFKHINISKDRINIPDGMAEDFDRECKNYDKRIEDAGGIDLQLLGIGRNGHIGFNEPGDALELNTHITDLTSDTINANARFFDSTKSVPKTALTMGIANIMKAKKIILLASGESKREAIKALLSGKITTNNPSTLLNLHQDVTIICDKAVMNQ